MLGADIDASGHQQLEHQWQAALRRSAVISGFNGSFDGLGHTISNLYVKTVGNGGLFATVMTGGIVRNVGMVGGSVSGAIWTGALVGSNMGTISNAYATGSVSGSVSGSGTIVGGLVGVNRAARSATPMPPAASAVRRCRRAGGVQ